MAKTIKKLRLRFVRHRVTLAGAFFADVVRNRFLSERPSSSSSSVTGELRKTMRGSSYRFQPHILRSSSHRGVVPPRIALSEPLVNNGTGRLSGIGVRWPRPRWAAGPSDVFLGSDGRDATAQRAPAELMYDGRERSALTLPRVKSKCVFLFVCAYLSLSVFGYFFHFFFFFCHHTHCDTSPWTRPAGVVLK